MTNTLTWDIKSIQLPKINSNLLSVVSLILLLTMAFLTVAVFADHCDDLKRAADKARDEWARATTAYGIAAGVAATACAAARKSKNGYVSVACILALAALALAAWEMSAKADAYLEAARAYLECLQNHEDDENGSGSSTTS